MKYIAPLEADQANLFSAQGCATDKNKSILGLLWYLAQLNKFSAAALTEQ